MLLYCCIAVGLSLPIMAMLYMKCTFNSIYILINNKRQDYKGQNLFGLFLTVLFSPAIILVSFIVDLIALPNLLLREEKGFEFKYQ